MHMTSSLRKEVCFYISLIFIFIYRKAKTDENILFGIYEKINMNSLVQVDRNVSRVCRFTLQDASFSCWLGKTKGSFISFESISNHHIANHFLSAPNIKQKIRIKMINAQGLDEAGIDGGGIFREFMSQLVKQAYDPSYGFFKSTPEQLLYPNPHVSYFSKMVLVHYMDFSHQDAYLFSQDLIPDPTSSMTSKTFDCFMKI